MASKNYTPIDDLIKKQTPPSAGIPIEAEPRITHMEGLQMQEAVELEPSEELSPFMKQRSETIKLPSELSKMGLQPAAPSQFSTYKNIKLPISDEKIIEGLNSPVSSSRRWLSELALYLLKQAHLTLRMVGGKIIRIVKLS